jgi:hypothetical protein
MKNIRGWRTLIGLALLAAGMYLLGQRLAREADIGALVSSWWPLIIITLGLANLVRLVERPWVWALIGPFILIGVGAVLLLYRLDRVSPKVSSLLWPLALVLLGLWIVLAGAQWHEGSPSSDPTFRRRILLRGEQIVRLPGPFGHAAVTVLFGAAKLDLRAATFNKRATINVLTVFGTVHVLVPDETDVDERRAFVLGRGTLRYTTLPPQGAKLTINILGLMGDVLVTRTTLWVPPQETTATPPNG